jgi:hypothetical protein
MTLHASDRTIIDWLAEHATELHITHEDGSANFLLEWRAHAGNRVHITGVDLRETATRAMGLNEALEKEEG